MATCYTCKKTMIGGVRAHGFRFCSKRCRADKDGYLQRLANVDESEVSTEAMRIMETGKCAKCGQSGNIDFHKAVFVWSAVLFTRTSEKTFIGCTSCARKTQALSAAGTILLGWWGIPFGPLMTPVAALANVFHMTQSRRRTKPSKLLLDYTRERLAYGQRMGVAGFADSASAG